MYKTIFVTNRHLTDHFWEQFQKVIESGVSAVILREKDLSEQEYEALARDAIEICDAKGIPLYLHTYTETAKHLNCQQIHLPLSRFLQMDESEKNAFREIGVSIHSVKEAIKAEQAGAAYVTAGHIFPTDCKKGLEPRGLAFLSEVCRSVTIPVYAIGGITKENAASCISAGAAGICLMSSLMKAEKPECIF